MSLSLKTKTAKITFHACMETVSAQAKDAKLSAKTSKCIIPSALGTLGSSFAIFTRT